MPSDLFSTLDAAWQRRAPLHTSANTNAYRLINRAGDGFPDLAVDRYGAVLVAHVYSQGRKVSPPRAVLQALADRVGAEAVYIKYRPVQGNVLDDRARRSLTPIEPLIGRAVERADERPGRGLRPSEAHRVIGRRAARSAGLRGSPRWE